MSEFGDIAHLKSGVEKHKPILNFPVGNMRQVKFLQNSKVMGLGWDPDMLGTDTLYIADLVSKKVSGSPIGEVAIPDTHLSGSFKPL